MSRASTKRRVVGTVTQLNPAGQQFLCNGQWFQLADRTEDKRLPALGQLVSFDAYDYGRGIETFFRFDDPNAPTCRRGHAMQPGQTVCAECEQIRAANPQRYPPQRITPAALRAPTSDRGFEIRKIALESASRTCREYAAESLVAYARQLEAYLAGPEQQPEEQPQPAPAPEPQVTVEQILAALSNGSAAQLLAKAVAPGGGLPVVAPPEPPDETPIRRKRSRAIA